MKILCIADVHGDRESLLRAVKFSRENGINSVIFLGDLSSYGVNSEQNLNDARFLINTFNGFNLMAVPGNCDSREILCLFDKANVNLHERIRSINDISLIGFGGSSPTPFSTPFELDENEIYVRLKRLLEKRKTEKTVLILHEPPRGTKCDLAKARHIGSKSIRRIVDEFQPDLVLCSHVHESGGVMDRIGETRIANIGVLSQGNIGILTLGDETRIKLRKM